VSTSAHAGLHPASKEAKERPRVAVSDGSVLELLVLCADERHCAGVELGSGALVRAWSPMAGTGEPRAYDVVEVVVSLDPDALPDPSEPEALGLRQPPRVVGTLKPRRAERLIRPLIHPERTHLLGLVATVVPFWERRADHPSIAVVEPKSPPVFWRQGSYLACRFEWLGLERELPCLDRSLAARMDRAGRTRMVAARGDRLVVALTPPIEGRCHKVVEGLLPRP